MWFEWSIEIDVLVNCSWVSNTKNDVEIVQYIYVCMYIYIYTHTHIYIIINAKNE